MNVTATKVGMRITPDQTMYPKKLGIRTPASSATARTMKFADLADVQAKRAELTALCRAWCDQKDGA